MMRIYVICRCHERNRDSLIQKRRNGLVKVITGFVLKGENLMNEIEETTKRLFSIRYETDFADESVFEKWEAIADDLIQSNDWLDIYHCWYRYLTESCHDEESILNFANLFWCYGGQEHYVDNAIEFVAYFYANIDFEKHEEACDVIDGIACCLFENSGIITGKYAFDEYVPIHDERVKKAIAR